MAPILLIHALFGSLDFPRILSSFGGQSVFAPDQLGYGVYRDMAPDSWSLQDQADHIATWLRKSFTEPVHVIGHSVGGAVAVLFARRYPEMARSLTRVEGNFTLSDAFWSQKIATQPLEEIETEVDCFRADVSAWIARSGVPATPFAVATAKAWLDNQPASTIRAQAKAVVAATEDKRYLADIRELLASGLPVISVQAPVPVAIGTSLNGLRTKQRAILTFLTPGTL
ncbi:alpha/beta fold hydrolase [Yersinia kristensenii]|uniref:alpha/beta fold hydrolase n=1 Tax=Yersinia kristensenii TaxID=28152 RepID=UPI003896E8EA